MNYLAHLYLSCTDEYLVMGNYLADILSIKEVRLMPSYYEKGFEMHRQIDAYTDVHPEVKKVVQLLRPRHGKYAPVISDVIFDYYLSKNWAVYSNISLREFADNIYHILTNHIDDVPEDYRDLVGRMVKGDFLMNYVTKEGMAWTFNKMQEKAKFASNFRHAMQDIEDFDDQIDQSFNLFFPDLIAYVSPYCQC